MLLYIDPGTGSMLFTLLIGVMGAAVYGFKTFITKVKFTLTGGKKADISDDRLPYVIFADDKRYWMVFEPVCAEFNKRGIDVVYMTASPDDPALSNSYEHIKAEFIGTGNKAFAKLNFIKADILLSTTPGLDVYQWKRSKDVSCYVHMLHGANEVAGYRMFGVDYYDAIMLSGEYQVQDVRYLEKIRNLPEKELVKIGVPYLDAMAERLKKDGQGADVHADNLHAVRTILVAPSWGKSGILSRYGEELIDRLIDTGYRIIIRPHPQSFTAEKELMDKLTAKYPPSDMLEWNRDADNFEVLNKADVLISDFSGVVFDFSLVFDKPVITADTEIDTAPYDFWWLDKPFWTLGALPRIGERLSKENIDNIKAVIDDCIENPKYKSGREEVRRETWEHVGEGAVRAVDYLTGKYSEITTKHK